MATKPDIDALYGLEPVFEPGAGPGSDALERFVDIDCPWCGETIMLRLDLSAGAQACIEDCQVCCRPIQIGICVDDAGALAEVSVERSDG